MPTYNFSAVTAAQALAITSADTLVMDLGAGGTTTVLFSAADQITIVAGDRSVVFGLGVATATKTYLGGGSLYIGGAGNDLQALAAGGDGLYGGLGNDTLGGGAGDDLLQGNQGGDSLNGGSGADILYGGQDDDVIETGADPAGGSDFGQGNRGNDTVAGSSAGADTLLGGQGNDVLNATSFTVGTGGVLSPETTHMGGADFLNGNLGNDTLFGGVGADRLFGEDGADYLQDIGGRNSLDGGEGNDTIISVSLSGANTVSGGGGADAILVGGSNVIDAGAGDDEILFFSGGSAAINVVSMGDGDDYCMIYSDIRSPGDRFTVDGGAGNDLINTGDGADSITGGIGADTIDGWAGADTVAGGAGSDTFEFFSGEAFTVFSQLDQIVDWSIEDRLFFANFDIDDPIGLANSGNYVSGGVRADYNSALAFANGQIATGLIDYVVVAVGGDVYVFCDSYYDAGVADSAVRLVGRTLADIGPGNFTNIGD